MLRAVMFAPEDLALVRGDPAERRRYLDELATTRRPRIAAVRADYDKVLRQRTALLKTAAGARHRGDRSVSRHPRRVGRPPRRTRGAADRGAGRAGQRAQPGGREGLPTACACVAACGDPVPQQGRADRRARTRPRSSSRRHCSTHWLAGATPRSSGASAWSAHTATISSCGSATTSRKALRAMANRGRWRWRCDWRPTNCCGPTAAIRCCCSTMCSPSWIPRAAGRWPSVAASAEQVLVTAAVGDDIPRDWDARRIEITMRDDDSGRVSVVGAVRTTDERTTSETTGDWHPPEHLAGLAADGHGPGAPHAGGGARRGAQPGQGRRTRAHLAHHPTRRRPPARVVGAGARYEGSADVRSGDADLARTRGWSARVAEGTVLGQWQTVVGEQIAAHATPTALREGVLSVSAESTAWATQLRMVQAQLLAKIAAAVGDGVVTSLKIVGPVAPSWRKGRYHIAGRGPRDTYG